jgi:hypothetical protein
MKKMGFPSATSGRNHNIEVKSFFYSRQGAKVLLGRQEGRKAGRQEGRKKSREAAEVNSPDREIGENVEEYNSEGRRSGTHETGISRL